MVSLVDGRKRNISFVPQCCLKVLVEALFAVALVKLSKCCWPVRNFMCYSDSLDILKFCGRFMNN